MVILSGMVFPVVARAALTITPSTWNIIGLDSNSPLTGPRYFPVGAKVCSNIAATNVPVDLVWDSANAYINTRSGSLSSITIPSIAAGACADAFFEVEVTQTALAFDTTRRYHISSGAVSTPTPRELYIEHLISQARNGVNDIKLNGVSIPAGGAMNLIVGNTYTIQLNAYTATQGYSQLEGFINFSNTLFHILGVSTTYSVVSAGNSGGVTTPYDKLYSNACLWENDPNSPNYRSCIGSGNAGGTVITTYTIKILSGGGTTQTLNSLLHDFSGSSFHYNADYSVGARIANIIDPAAINIAKNFFPNPTNAGGVATLSFTLSNPNAGAVGGVNFIDVFPVSPGAMTLSDTTTTNTCGGTLTNNSGGALAIGSAGIKLSGATIPANSSCSVQVNVTMPVTGSYTNTSNHLFVDALDTGKFATATLTVNSTPPPPAASSTCTAPVQLAAWNFDALAAGANSAPTYSAKAADVATATASYTGTGASAIDTTQSSTAPNSWSGAGWAVAATGFPAATTAPYFDFVLDTSKYGGVTIASSYYIGSGAWAAPANNFLYFYSSANGGAFSTILNYNLPKGAWQAIAATAAAATGTSTTTFRINAAGAKTSTDPMYMDSVTFSGCTIPDPTKLAITKSYAANPVAVGGTSTLTFSIANTNATSTASLTNISFIDTLPMQNLQGTAAVTNGSPTVTGTGSAFKTQLVVGSIVSIAGVPYTVASITSNIVLTLTANYAAATSGGLTLTAGQTYVSTTSNTCGGAALQNASGGVLAAGASGIKLPGGTLAPGGACAIVVLVKANTSGALQNVSGFISSTETGTNTSSSGVAKATLTAITPPVISKLFGANPILANGISALTFTITNPNQNDALSGVAFSDTFPIAPGAMKVAATPNAITSGCGAPTYAPVAGAASITFSAATIAAGSTCTVKVDVTAPTTGSYTNTSNAVTATTAGTGNTASDTLTVTGAHPQISLLKQASSSATGPWSTYQPITTGANVYYQFTVENPGDVDLSTVSISDPDFGGAVPGCNWATLLKYDSKTCTAGPVLAASGVHINTATASGTYSATTYTDESSAYYVTVGLTLVKSATQTYFVAAGNVLNYSYVVQNTGSATLQGPVTVVDDKTTVTCPAVSTAIVTSTGLPGDGDNWLDPGEQITCTANYAVTAADMTAKLVTNTASATISSVTSPVTSLAIPLAPDLTAVKSNNVSGVVSVGNTFNWTLYIANTSTAGPATFTSGQTLLTDDLPSSGATYAVGAVKKTGTTGTINCLIAGNTLTCAASGGSVIIPSVLQGTLSVTNGSAAITGAGTSFTTELMAGSVMSLNGVSYTVASIASNTALTLTASYAGATAGGIAVPGSFVVPVVTTATALGSLVNPRSGGMCRVDPGTVVAEINEANNDCANTVTVSNATPSLTFLKTVSVYSDPVNGTSNPKYIPGASALYTLIATNSGSGPVDNDALFITDPVPANAAIYVNDIGGAGSGPVSFSQGTTSSGLTYSYTAPLNNPANDLSFSNDNGVTWTALPVAGADGCDPTVTHIRINPKGAFVGNPSAPSPSFSLSFRVCVK